MFLSSPPLSPRSLSILFSLFLLIEREKNSLDFFKAIFIIFFPYGDLHNVRGGDDLATYVGVPALVGNRAKAGQSSGEGVRRGTCIPPSPSLPPPIRISTSAPTPSHPQLDCSTAFSPAH